MQKKGLLKRIVVVSLITSMIFSVIGCKDKNNEKTVATEEKKQETGETKDEMAKLPELESWEGVKIKSSGKNIDKAIITESGVSLVYDDQLKKNIMKFEGSEGYLSLPEDVWKNVEEGFSIALKVKPEENSSARLFQTNIPGYGVGDTVWFDAPEISLTTNGDVRVYVGGRTIGGTYTPNATYNNGIAGDDSNYSEPNGHKTRYEGSVDAYATDTWSEIIVSVSTSEISIYVNGEKREIKVNEALGCDIASSLEYLFGNYEGGEKILKDYIYTSIGNSVYSTDSNFKGSVADLRIYTYALSDEEANKLPDDAEYVYDFDTEDIDNVNASSDYTADLSKYLGNVALIEVDKVKTSSTEGINTVQVWSDSEGRYYYSVKANDTVIVESSLIGLILEEGDLSIGLTLDETSVKTQNIDETYDIITGANATATNKCNETRFTLKNDTGSFDFVIRAFDDGVAYKYENVSIEGKDKLVVTDELSEVIFQPTADVWSFPLNGTYEGEYVKRTGKQMENVTGKLSTPMLINQDDYWMVLSEASVFNNNGDYCSSALGTDAGTRVLDWDFGWDRNQNDEAKDDLDSPGHIDITNVETRNGFATPWRVMVISNDLETLCESNIIPNLNPEADSELFADTSWIKPGVVAWSWWAEDAAQGNYDKHIEYIDFAAENGWDYVCLDVGWRAFEDRLPEMCDYANSKGVGIFVWINYRDMKTIEEMETLFGKWAAAGAVGLKTDYFESDAQVVLNAMENCAIVAAKNKMMILYHGCVRPAGEYRTYPNILSTEAVQGEEWHKWFAYPTVENCLLYPFSRNVLGSMDYTPVATKVGSNDSTYGFGLAMTVVYESALQHMAYAASSYKSYNGLSFLNNLVTTWDESILVEGVPGEYITYARRNAENWYIGAMTKEARNTSIKLEFLNDGEYNAYIYKDNEDGTQLLIEEKKVSKSDTLSFDLLAAGGVAVLITKDTIDTTVAESEDMNNPNFTYYEAESKNNTLAGAAVYQSSAFCSGSQKVGYVGNGAANTLTFNNINVDKTGTYKLMLYYCCGENRAVTLTVNGDKTYEMSGLNSGDYVHTSVSEIEIELQAGDNIIMLSNASYFAPDIDRIAVSK
ncbi:MAG: glycoside hydrolase family 97 catalytic domain-containing protein [Lachnospiraceae bacterium]|nr:glycoside hydrolase family 97 catalytic domain-containing protein [Lachnospiraceae bacterium]